MFRFANPEYFYLLIILPLLVLGFIWSNIKKRKDVEKLGDLRLVKRLMPALSLKRSYLKFWLVFTMVALCIIMIARPQFGSKEEKVEKEGIELVIAIDVSNSMLARDVSPDRLTRAKQILSRIITERKNDKVAIVVFAGEAFIQMPMTSDTQSAKLFLDNIDPSLVAVQGTVIGSAINVGMSCFSSDQGVDKALVLITDGEGHEDNGVEMAEAAAKAGIQVDVLGVGSPEGAPVPVSANSNEVKKDNDGNPVTTKLNVKMCEEIATAGKGKYIHVDNSNSALKNLQNELSKLQTKHMQNTVYSTYDEKFQFFAWLILILLIVEICVFDKKNKLFKNIKLFKK